MKRLLLMLVLTASACLAQESGAGGASEGNLAIWKWVNFAILAAGLGYLMAKHLPAFFQSRTAAIRKSIDEAQKEKRAAEERAAAMERRLGALGAEIEKFRTQAQAEMQQEGERIRQETAAQIRSLERQAELEVESASKAARRDLQSYAADLALDLAEQRVRARLNPQVEAGLVDSFVNDLKRRESNN